VVGTKLLEIMVTGKTSGTSESAVCGLTDRPTQTPIQLTA
jgi:hypothetical protein